MADLFSKQAAVYARSRPNYPPELFKFLASAAPSRGLAWDAATGSGQAALGLAEHFAAVYASDASGAQVAQAPPHPRVRYAAEPAERCSLGSGTADLANCSQGLHWLALEAFYAELRRVLKPGGVFSATVYGASRTASPELDRVVERFRKETLRDYWAPEAWRVITEYRGLPFPFEEIKAPEFEMRRLCGLDELLGYLRSWSAVQTWIDRRGENPLEALQKELRPVWGEPGAQREFAWKLVLKLGRLRP